MDQTQTQTNGGSETSAEERNGPPAASSIAWQAWPPGRVLLWAAVAAICAFAVGALYGHATAWPGGLLAYPEDAVRPGALALAVAAMAAPGLLIGLWVGLTDRHESDAKGTLGLIMASAAAFAGATGYLYGSDTGGEDPTHTAWVEYESVCLREITASTGSVCTQTAVRTTQVLVFPDRVCEATLLSKDALSALLRIGKVLAEKCTSDFSSRQLTIEAGTAPAAASSSN